MNDHGDFLGNVIVVKNTIIQHFSSVSEQNSIIFDEIDIDPASKNVEIRFSFISNVTGKRYFISDYRIPSYVILGDMSGELVNTDYFIKFSKFVRDDAASYLEHTKSERTEVIISESILFIKKSWPHILFIGAVLYILSL